MASTRVTDVDWLNVLQIVGIGLALAVLGWFIDNDLTREETIAAVRTCESAGMDAKVIVNGLTGRPRDVACVPKARNTNDKEK